MPKICTEPDCLKMVFSHLKCRDHQWKRTDSKWMARLANQEAKKKEKKPAIKKESEKRAKENRQYSKDRIEFLARPENKYCRLYPNTSSNTVHHKHGRIGSLLLDQRYWIPLSLEAHQWVEEHPLEAKKLGLSGDRLSMDENKY